MDSLADTPTTFLKAGVLVQSLVSEQIAGMASPMGIDEGEIIESGSEKANKSPPSVNGISVDSQSRNTSTRVVSLSQAPFDESGVTERHQQYQRRSPPRASVSSRGEKRGREAYPEYERERSDPRCFKVHYEDRLSDERRRSRVSYADLDYGGGSEDHRHQNGRDADGYHHKRPRTRSRSPAGRPRIWEKHRGRSERGYVEDRSSRYSSRTHGERGGYDGSGGKPIKAQSVSERGDLPVPPELSRREAELRMKESKQDHTDTTAMDDKRYATRNWSE